MHIDFLLHRFETCADDAAIVWKKQAFTYSWLEDKVLEFQEELVGKVPVGGVVSLTADFSPNSIALFLALAGHGCIIVPFLQAMSYLQRDKMSEIAQAEYAYQVDENDEVRFRVTGHQASHELYSKIRDRKHPGLVLFSSGSSGTPKAAVHDFTFLLEKFKEARPSLRILNFLLFDHWGGLNTMLHTLSSGGTVLTVQERSPDGICQAIEEMRIEVLPASPTFLNLLLISGAYQRHSLSSLKTISYGTEPMPESTLKRIREILPDVKLHQTYGLIELGVLRSKSKSDDSLWVKIGGEGYETRIVDGLLQIKARSAMLGYLNAPSPFTEDGWFKTGDAVEVDGEYFRILGRKSELINVGGEKVYPQEVESVIQQVQNIAEVTVFGEKSALMGNIVCARVRLIEDEDAKAVTQRIKLFCKERLAAFKVPVKIEVLTERMYNDRYKKVRVKPEAE